MGRIGGSADFVKINVWNPDTLAYEVMTQPLVKTDTLDVDVEFPVSQAVTGTFWQTTQPVSASELPLPSGAATSAKQLADNHQVSVSNFPATQPVSGTVTVANPTANPETGLATSAKQDTLLTELQLKADLTETQPTADANFEMLLRSLIQGIHNPAYYNGVSNALQALLITGSTTAVTGTLTAVTTVTGITNIGGIGADMLIQNFTSDMWGICIRSMLT